MVLIVLIGVYPKPFLDRIKPPLVPIVAQLSKVKARSARRSLVARTGGDPGPEGRLHHHRRLKLVPTTFEVRPSMTAIESARQTLLILLPEVLILLSAITMMTAGAFVAPASAGLVDRLGGDLARGLAWRWSLLRNQVTDPYGRPPSTTPCRATAGSFSC